MLEAGHPAVLVNPNAIKAWRDGAVLSGAKTDTGDADVIAEYLRLLHHCGRRSAEQLLTRLRTATAGTVDATPCEAIRDAVWALVSVLKAIAAGLKDLARSVVAQGEHLNAEIFTSPPRSGRINTAQMLAEWGDCSQAHDGPRWR